MQKVRVQLDEGWPPAFDRDDVSELDEALKEQGFEVYITLREGVSDVGPEVLEMAIKVLDHVPWEDIRGALVAAGVDWLRKRFKKSKKAPKYLKIFGPDGEVLKHVQLEREDGDTEDI